MKIKLLTDFGGRETNDLRYVSGDVLELGDELAQAMIEVGKAEAYQEQKPEPAPIMEPDEWKADPKYQAELDQPEQTIPMVIKPRAVRKQRR